MLAWLGGLLLGAWQAWPLLREPRRGGPASLVAAATWLVLGFAAWLLALNFGRQRYWTARPRRR